MVINVQTCDSVANVLYTSLDGEKKSRLHESRCIKYVSALQYNSVIVTECKTPLHRSMLQLATVTEALEYNHHAEASHKAPYRAVRRAGQHWTVG